MEEEIQELTHQIEKGEAACKLYCEIMAQIASDYNQVEFDPIPTTEECGEALYPLKQRRDRLNGQLHTKIENDRIDLYLWGSIQ